MLLAYILTKQRFMKVKLVKNKAQGVFRKEGFEYQIDRKKIYTKKILGFKLVFWSMYLEGNPNPIEFSERGYSITEPDIPIDELALLIRRIIRGTMEIIMLLGIALVVVLQIWLVMKIG